MLHSYIFLACLFLFLKLKLLFFQFNKTKAELKSANSSLYSCNADNNVLKYLNSKIDSLRYTTGEFAGFGVGMIIAGKTKNC